MMPGRARGPQAPASRDPGPDPAARSARQVAEALEVVDEDLPAARLHEARRLEATEDAVDGLPREARGATVSGSQVHSVRLPGFVISAEVVFGMPDQKLTIRHDSGSSARPYVDGALLAIRKVSTLVGVHRGLDTVLDLDS